MTLTTEQLDELERFARAEQKAGWPKCAVEFDVTLHLVAVYRAALAWMTASKQCAPLRDGWRRGGGDDNLVEIQRLDKTINESRRELERLLGVRR